jgi:hypothetical protein
LTKVVKVTMSWIVAMPDPGTPEADAIGQQFLEQTPLELLDTLRNADGGVDASTVALFLVCGSWEGNFTEYVTAVEQLIDLQDENGNFHEDTHPEELDR